MDNKAPQLRFAWKPFLVQSQIVSTCVLAQFFLHSWTDQRPQPVSPDILALYFLLFGAVNLLVMYVGDLALRAMGQWRKTAYMALGGLGASAAHVTALAPAAYAQAAHDGILVALLGVPLLIGAAAAFLMHKSLGFIPEGDNPPALAAVTGQTDGAAAVHDIGTAEYYDGPLQVRTSAMAAFLAALVAAALYVVMTLMGLIGDPLPAGALPPVMRNNPILGAIYGMIGLSIPFYIFVSRAHGFLQRRGKAEVKSYALAGVFVPLGFALFYIALLGPLGFIFVLPWVFPSTVAMLVYHRLAGMEPLDLPDDIEVRDPRTMLPADHVRRRVRRAIRT